VYLSAEQAQRLLGALRGDRLEALYRLMLATGLRRGEALALHWPDVDLDAAFVRVRWTLSRTSRGLELGEPKTEGSRQTVPLPRSAIETLRNHRIRQSTERQAAGPAWTESGLVFTTEVGTALEPRNVLRRFDTLAHRAGLEGVHLHTLRHSAASFLLAAGTHTRRSYRSTSGTRPTPSPPTSTATSRRRRHARLRTVSTKRSSGERCCAIRRCCTGCCSDVRGALPSPVALPLTR
jgi:integrase